MGDRRTPTLLRKLIKEAKPPVKDADSDLPSFELLLKVGVEENMRFSYIDLIELIPHKDGH